MSATMIPLSNDKLLTDAEMRRLREGSYEDKVSRIQTAVLASASDHFVEGSTVEVLATHPDKAIVTADGHFFEVRLAETTGKEVRIVGVSPLKVEAYDKDNLSHYVQREAQEAVDLFMRGSTQAAVDRILAAVPYINKSTASNDYSLESVQSEISKNASWKKTLTERSQEIKKLIRTQLGQGAIEAPREAKFRLLHEETDREKLTGYKNLVSEDLDNVIHQITTLWEDAVEAREVAGSAVEGHEDTILSVFSSFVSGLVEDLQSLGERATVASAASRGDVAAQSKLHDMLIEGLRPYEVGTRFAVAVAQRLDEAK